MRRGPLIIYNKDNGITRAFRNIPGKVSVRKLSDVITEFSFPATNCRTAEYCWVDD
jgi:hypothetical protein